MTASRRGRRPARRSGGFWGGLKDILIIIVVAVVVSFVIRTFFFRAFLIPSGSMENTLQINDRIFVNLIVDSQDQLKRGDVVVFEDHEWWLPPSVAKSSAVFQALEFVGLYPSNAEQHMVKLIIGMQGDHVTVDPKSHQLVINDTAMDESYSAEDIVGSDIEFYVTVPDGKLWVMGD